MIRYLALLLIAGCAGAQTLPGTEPLTRQGDLGMGMVESIDRYLMRRIETSPARREQRWFRDFSSARAYEKSVDPNRERLRRLIGAIDERVEDAGQLFVETAWPAQSERRPADSRYTVSAVRWDVLPGVTGEGLLLAPVRAPVARVVALPDADQSPEAIAGLAPSKIQYARRLAESGCLVLIPVVIDRKDTFSGNPAIRFTNQPHREYVYRMAYEMGRHPVGYEVEKVLAAVDFFGRLDTAAPIGVAGYGEGGMVALYSAALDKRIDAVLVSGYFGPRGAVWQEPIYRNIWGQLEEFGDAEIASLVAPRGLVVETSRHPEGGPPPEREGRRGASPGRISTPAPAAVRQEFERVTAIYGRLGVKRKALLADTGGEAGSDPALSQFLEVLGAPTDLAKATPGDAQMRKADEGAAARRMKRQFEELVDYTQGLVRRADRERAAFWAKADSSSLASWKSSTDSYRRIFDEEILGALPASSGPPKAETRILYDKPAYRGYEVVIPVWDDVPAYGILLVPKDLKKNERRPLVVCQHGLEGRPQHLVEPPDARTEEVYAHYAAQLAERGFIVYVPQNPYLGGESFRVLLRKANPVKLSLFSFIVGQHRRTLDWLEGLPFVDPKRMAFYGLSYGGKTAMRVPPLEPRYSVVICSGDFNEWIWKITSVEAPFSYMFTHEYDMLEFNLGNTFNYYELATLIAPRPFMVERGHRDGVGIDEWIAYEFAKVRRFYDRQGIGNRVQLEFFDGPHQIHGVGTFEFLHQQLGWPKR